MLAIPFPNIDPAIFTVDLFGMSLSLRWYALAYILGLVLGWRYVIRLVREREIWPGGKAPMTPDQPEELLTWMVVGVILGGRLGFVLFYQPGYYLENPSQIPVIWEGGMSFHGGFIGVIVGILLYGRAKRLPILSIGDAVACAAPIGLLLGRLANFVNAELWGRPTTMPWGVIFPGARAQDCPEGWEATCARHPSQLYEAALEGAVLFLVMWWLATRAGWLKRPGALIGVFFLGYGLARSVVEAFRQGDPQFVGPDNPWGHAIRFGTGPEAFGLTMGQVLSLPMIAIGLAFVWRARRPERPPAAP